MATFTKNLLSGSTTGKAITITATATTGDTIHTAVSGTSNLDEIWIYANNIDTVNHNLTIEWGTTTVTAGNITLAVEFGKGVKLVIPGLLLQNSLVVTAFADTTNVILITGYVNSIS